MDPRLIAAYVFAILFDVAFPIGLALCARRKLGASWRYFWYGALIFFLFQLATRVPAIQLLQPMLAGPLSRSPELMWVWLFTLALTAGLFEEGGRYLGYRYLIFRRSPGLRTEDSGHSVLNPQSSVLSPQSSSAEAWKKGVMYGLGHGGLESMLLVGGTALLSFVNALAVTRLDPATVAALPQDQATAVRQAQALFSSLAWWMPLLGAFERLCTVGIQVAFSLLVLQCFLRGSPRWLYLAIGAHFLVDFVTMVAAPRLGPVATEGVIALFALGALYLIFRLRPAAEPSPA